MIPFFVILLQGIAGRPIGLVWKHLKARLMEGKIINPILHSMVNVLQTMANIPATPGKPSLKTNNEALGVITGVIEMRGPNVKGSIAISFPKEVILDISNKMLDENLTEVNESTKDLTGEILNMVLGGAKEGLQKAGLDLGLTLPEVLVGEGHQIIHPFKGPKIVLPFKTELGEFYVEICSTN